MLQVHRRTIRSSSPSKLLLPGDCLRLLEHVALEGALRAFAVLALLAEPLGYEGAHMRQTLRQPLGVPIDGGDVPLQVERASASEVERASLVRCRPRLYTVSFAPIRVRPVILKRVK